MPIRCPGISTILAVIFPFCLSSPAGHAQTAESVKLAGEPALSPDGKTIVFAWHGDLWKVSAAGGTAMPLTRHAGRDREPRFSPDGKMIAFVSDREGTPQIFLMPAEGGTARQITFHTGGSALADWFPDGKSILTSAARDHFWRKPERFFRVSVESRSAETLLFDDYGTMGSMSPDGRKLLFVREGSQWWRKGYTGSQAPRIWLYDLDKNAFTKLIDTPEGAYSPIWSPDGKGFYYVGLHRGTMNLRRRNLDGSDDKPLTNFDDDLVVQPSLARDGKSIVFRHLFDLYRLDLTKPDATPEKLDIRQSADAIAAAIDRRALTSATRAAFKDDGLETAFIAGGDVWVMDTELCEPRRVTATPEEERGVVFAPDGKSLVFVSDSGGQTDLWRARRADEDKAWWENEKFTLDRITNDAETESDPKFAPAGGKLAYVKGLGQFIIAEADGTAPKKLMESWNAPDYDWSPDGKWVVYALSDDDFNSDIWIRPIDGSKPPVNVSRHPDNDTGPVWSPDGRTIAFTGRRMAEETDIYYLHLRKEDEDESARDRKLKKAREKMKAARRKDTAKPGETGVEAKKDEPKKDEPSKKPVEVVIDFEVLADRLKRVTIANATESDLFWSADSKKLAFSATIDAQRGTYAIEPPEDLKPKKLSATTGRNPRWLEAGNQIVWLAGGVPGSLTAAGKETAYRFRALQEVKRGERFRAGFEQAWRTMRDQWYDERLGNRNWDAIRRKYAEAAENAPDLDTLAIVIQLMLGELNGSHLGFYPGVMTRPDPNAEDPAASGPSWRPETAWLGARFDPAHKGPGLKIRDIVKDTPADREGSRLAAGETILAIDDKPVDPSMDLAEVLNGPLDREIRLKVAPAAGEPRTVTIRPVSYRAATRVLYGHWIDRNRAIVEKLSEGKLGYLHIRAMDETSFRQFEQDLYDAGAGKEGLVIDVRENGGGSTADLLLTSLTQPVHAYTVPRGSSTPGYPQDRMVFATWRKPIIVLCNQNSFSNAEIFSHAIKTLKRGKLVGVPTAGGVISTGGTSITDIGFLRLPFRGWYLRDTGEDLELNGAVPDVTIWPAPGDMPAGKDDQLTKAVELLKADVEAEKAKPRPTLRKATAR